MDEISFLKYFTVKTVIRNKRTEHRQTTHKHFPQCREKHRYTAYQKRKVSKLKDVYRKIVVG